MNPFEIDFGALFTACRKALLGAPDWNNTLDTSAQGLRLSYAALALSIPAYYICALAITTERAQISGQAKTLIPPLPFALAALVYLLSFSASVYIICAAVNKRAQFRPWVILRHWSAFFCVLFAASLYGLYLLGLMPFMAANFAALILYLATLAIDIRLAQRAGELELTPAIFTACIIFAMGLSVLLIGVVQIGGAL